MGALPLTGVSRSSKPAWAVLWVLLVAFGGCSDSPSPPAREVCDNGRDDDGDTLADCADPDCQSLARCAPDGGADAMAADGPLPVALQTVVSALTLPTSGDEYAVDLDKNGSVDNRVGVVLAALVAVNPNLNLQKDLDQQLAEGKILVLQETRARGLSQASTAVLQTLVGKDSDGDPSNNFSGSAVLVEEATGPALAGEIDAGKLDVGPGELTTPVPVGVASVVVKLVSARAWAHISSAGMTDGVVVGAVPMNDISTTLLPALAVELDRQYHAAQTTPAGKKALQDVFDLDKDGTITEQELRTNPIIAALISTPDVDTDSDGKLDAFSIGFGFTSVPCTITKP